MFTVAVDTRQAAVGQKELLTSGSVGIEIQFTFSEDWTGLTRTAVFRLGEDEDTKADIVLTETNTCVIPHEVLAEDGEPVFAGVYGFDGITNEIVIPTVWASLGVVKPGVKPGTPATPAPTPSVVEQIQQLASEAHQSAGDALSTVSEAMTKIGPVAELAEQVATNAEAAAASALAAEGYAVGKQNGVNVDSSSPYYHANALYFASAAWNNMGNAALSESNAAGSALAASGAADRAEAAQAAIEAGLTYVPIIEDTHWDSIGYQSASESITYYTGMEIADGVITLTGQTTGYIGALISDPGEAYMYHKKVNSDPEVPCKAVFGYDPDPNFGPFYTVDWYRIELSATLGDTLTLGKGTADEVTMTAAQLKALLELLN